MNTSKTTPKSGTDNPPIVFFGTETYSLWVLEALVEAGFRVAAVVTKPDTARGRGHTITAPAVKSFAQSHGIDVWQPDALRDIIPRVQALDRPIGILVAFGRIIPEEIIQLFTPGIINLHPSLLPIYRGPSPVEAAIANRDKTTGISIMLLSKEMDAGPVYIQVPYVLDFSETKPELYRTLFTMGAHILVQRLPEIIDGSLRAAPQDNKAATYCPLLKKSDGILDLQHLTPGQAEARVRAYLGFPRTQVSVGPYQLIVTKAHGVMDKKTPLDLECANGAFLSIDEVIAPSGKTMAGSAFLRGYPLEDDNLAA